MVTGATRGIGRAIVDRLMAEGQPVVGIARRADPSFPAPLQQADLPEPARRPRLLAQIGREGPGPPPGQQCRLQPDAVLGRDHAWRIREDLRAQLQPRYLIAARPCSLVMPAAAAGSGRCRIVEHRQPLAPWPRRRQRLCGGKAASRRLHALLGARAGAARRHRQLRRPRADRDRDVRAEQSPGQPRPRRHRCWMRCRCGAWDCPAKSRPRSATSSATAPRSPPGQTLFVCGGASISQIHL